MKDFLKIQITAYLSAGLDIICLDYVMFCRIWV